MVTGCRKLRLLALLSVVVMNRVGCGIIQAAVALMWSKDGRRF